jgi:hypothetical protein
MGKVVIQDAHMSHVLTYRDSLGFLDRLHHIVTLLLSGVHREDCQLVELDTVQKSGPGTDANSLVGDTIHADPRIFGVHFLHNLVPLGLLVPNNKQAEHLICLASHHNRSAFLCLEVPLNCSREALQSFLASLDSSGGT